MSIFAMGEYGPYVWSSFSLTLIVLIICVMQARRRHHNIFNDIRTRLTALESGK